jgi:AcrR family transcriptional regulator
MLLSIPMKSARQYTMVARAESAEETRRRVLAAAVDEVWRHRVADVRLQDVAAKSGVTTQTVLRLFGTRSQLLDAALEAMRDRIMEQRGSASPGDISATVTALFDHYEDMGDFVIRNLAEEHAHPELADWLERGRAAHRQSMERQFGPWLAGRNDRALLVDCLVVACDVYTWKLLRRDLRKSRKDAEACVRRSVNAILECA